MAATYEDSVFLNVPFDSKYSRLFDALVFSVHDCGFIARSALEIEDSGQARVEKILTIIGQSKFGIHDISRAGIDRQTRLARFNMPLELGFFWAPSGTGPHVTVRSAAWFWIVSDSVIETSAPTYPVKTSVRTTMSPETRFALCAIGLAATEQPYRCRAARRSSIVMSVSERSFPCKPQM